MSIRNQIEAVVQTLTGSPAFIYGTANELNLLADDAIFPCVFMHTIQAITISPQINGSVSNSFSVVLEFLYKTEFNQFTADNETYVSQALHMANEFIVKAARYRDNDGRYFKIKARNLDVKCQPVYNKYDVNTTGISLTIKN
jgi:hypothetical protein